jgi:hypothetical protein
VTADGGQAGAIMKWAKVAVGFVAGVIAAVVSQMLTGWWLDSGRGVTVMMAMLCALSLALVWLDRRAPLALWAGVVNATTVILFMVGPGTIFPIVIAFAAVLSALAIAPSWLIWKLGTAARSGVRHVMKRP